MYARTFLLSSYPYVIVFDHHSGAALLVEAADMGNADAQYELGCRLRVEVRLPYNSLFVTTR